MEIGIRKKSRQLKCNIYCISDNYILVKEGEYIIFYDNEMNNKGEIYFPAYINNLQVCENEILILDDSNKPSLFEHKYNKIIKKNVQINKDEFIDPIRYASFDKFLVSKEIEFPIYKKGIYYSKIQYVKYFNNDFAATTIISDIFYGNAIKRICRFNEETGLSVWCFSIADFPPYINGFFREQEADIKQIVGVYNNILWVHVGGFRLIGIAIDTGKLVHEFKDVLKGGDNNNFLDIENGVLKTLSYDYYSEFDLQTFAFRKKITINGQADIKIRASSFYEKDKCLYFCGYHNNQFDKPNAFGIFDTEKAEIVWYDTTKDDLGYFYNPPQANNKLLAVLDDRHNLLIYERDAMK